MSLPRKVAEAEALAEKLQEQLLKGQQPTESPNGGDGGNQQNEQTGQQPASNESVDLADIKPTGLSPNPAADDGSHATGDNWEHRFKVLQGKYNSEVPRLAAENKELKGSLKAIQEQLEDLKNAKPVEPLVKQEEIDEYGEGLIDVARRIAREELATKDSEISKLKAKLETLEGVTTKTVEKDFYSSLEARVPDWTTINQDKSFHQWLDEVDELTGLRRQDLLSQAEQNRDADRVVKFFTAFKKTSQKQVAAASNALETQVAPNSTKTPNTPPSKKIWSRAEIADFYKKVRTGSVSDKDIIAIESDIHAATIEGRIR
jgi:hypothetical protein